MDNPTSLLVVEDDEATASFLAENLAADGFKVATASGAGEGLRAIEVRKPQLVILDLLLEDGSGLALLDRVRSADGLASRIDPDVPVIVLSGRSGDADRVRSFARGADDHVPKPFLYQELLARVRALLRPNGRPQRGVMRVGELTLDPSTRAVRLGGRPVHLAAKEFALLQALAEDPTRVFGKQELLRDVWGYLSMGNTRRKSLSRSTAPTKGGPPAMNLKLILGDTFPHQVAAYLRTQGEQARNRAVERGDRHSDTGALFEFADFVERLGQDDQRLRILQLVQTGAPHPVRSDSTDPYLPGLEQRTWIARYGVDKEPPEVSAALDVLASEAVDDLLAVWRESRKEDTLKLEAANVKLEALAAAEERAATLEAQNVHQQSRIAELEAESADLEKRLAFLNLIQPESGQKRRQSVEGHSNIYQRINGEGVTTYEVGWRDDGKQRWETIGESLEEAVTFRDEKLGKVTANA